MWMHFKRFGQEDWNRAATIMKFGLFEGKKPEGRKPGNNAITVWGNRFTLTRLYR